MRGGPVTQVRPSQSGLRRERPNADLSTRFTGTPAWARSHGRFASWPSRRRLRRQSRGSTRSWRGGSPPTADPSVGTVHGVCEDGQGLNGLHRWEPPQGGSCALASAGARGLSSVMSLQQRADPWATSRGLTPQSQQQPRRAARCCLGFRMSTSGPLIDRRYPLRDVPEALRYQGEGHSRGKIVITV